MHSIGERIAEQRRRLGLSQEELAEKLKAGRQTIIRYESGQTNPNSDAIIKLCKLFAISADYLLGLTDTPNYRSDIHNSLEEKENIPEPITLAAHETDGEPEVSEERMKEIIKQVYHLIIKNERH